MQNLPAILKRTALVALWLACWGGVGHAQVGHWKLQDNAASTTVVATVGSNGTAARNTSLTSTAGNGTALTLAYDANGSTDEISIPSTSFAGAGTICFWAKRSGSGTFDIAIGNSAGTNKIGFSATAGQFFVRGVNGGSSASPSHGVTDTNWNHFAVIRNSSDQWLLYVNGVQVGGTLFTQSGSSSWNRIAVDDNSSPHVNHFSGSLIDVRIYDNALDATAIAAIMAEKDLPAGGKGLLPLFLRLQFSQAKYQADHFATYGVYALAP